MFLNLIRTFPSYNFNIGPKNAQIPLRERAGKSRQVPLRRGKSPL